MTEKEMQELARKERNRYHREWRARNKGKVKEINDRYWAKKALENTDKEAQA